MTSDRATGADRDPPLDLSLDHLLHDWRGAFDRARAYLAALGVDASGRDALARSAVEAAAGDAGGPGWNAHEGTLAHLRRQLQERYPPAGATRYAADGFPDWRLRIAIDGLEPGPEPHAAAWQADARALAMPPIRRRSMRPHHLRRRRLRPELVPLRTSCTADGYPPGPDGTPDTRPLATQRRAQRWWWSAIARRSVLTLLILLPSVVAANFMIEVLPHQGRIAIEVAIALFFGALFGWISIGFWTALLGFFVLLFRRDRYRLAAAAPADAALPDGVRVAVVMPICAEPVDRVFAGLRVTYDSLARTDHLRAFDFFVLSDTSDPSLWVHEEAAWLAWCRDTGGFGRIFYRRRRIRLQRKSGNIADFCRRWGRSYRYMVVLDADSVMSGDALVSLVQMMEQRPRAAIVQTLPMAVGRRSVFARAQQFAGRVYGPMFSAGLHFWQLGDGQYWGHNAILRIAPFVEHCDLPQLPGTPPLGGEILSHDFVEAALLGRAGWEMWLAYDLPGSYEETSSSLLEEMKRDRRWCQGNLQHLRLLRLRGLIGAHRALFLNGVLSYVSALLWFCFLTLSTAAAILEVLRPPDYFPEGPSLFPQWPVWRPDWALALVGVTAAILFLPKLLGLLLAIARGPGARAFGGLRCLLGSALLEIVLSSLFAPIRMVFHTRFVLTNALGYTVGWRSSSREDAETRWREALAHHGADTFVAAAWGLGVYLLNPGYFWWLTPIIVALVLSVPISVLASRVRLGDAARRHGLLATPDEIAPAPVLRTLAVELERIRADARSVPAAERDGFVRAIVDPCVNAIHRALLGPARRSRGAILQRRQELLARAVNLGPAALSPTERLSLLYDPQIVTDAHRAVWSVAERDAARRWGRPGITTGAVELGAAPPHSG